MKHIRYLYYLVLQNFRGRVIGCIEADFANKLLVFSFFQIYKFSTLLYLSNLIKSVKIVTESKPRENTTRQNTGELSRVGQRARRRGEGGKQPTGGGVRRQQERTGLLE